MILKYYLKNLIIPTFIKVINCINSTPMTSEILKRFKFYRENSEIPLEEKDWDDIKINEIIYIKYPKKFSVKIKDFRNELLKLDDKVLLYIINIYSIDNLCLDGLIRNSMIKFNPKIEEYSKKLMKHILLSKQYTYNFVRYDNRFNSKNIENILGNILKGENSDLIFEEIRNNIFFIPFAKEDLSGFNNRN